MKNESINIASKIKKIRKLKNMTQDDLSTSSGINISTIKKYEAGIRIPKREQLVKIADALGVSVNYFYKREIKTIGEILSTLISLEDYTDLKISCEKDKYGNYIPESIKFNYNNADINNFLMAYLLLRDAKEKTHYNKTETHNTIDELLINNTPISKPIKDKKNE